MRQFDIYPAQTTVTGDPETLALDYQGLNKVIKVSADVRIQKSGEEYFCQALVHAVVSTECSRCLTDFELAVKQDTDFIACSQLTHDEKAGDEPDDEDYVFFTGTDIQADISEIVRQAIILAVDLKPICSEDCLGLCQQCGINLNEESCNCVKETIDPRWEALKNLTSGSATEHKEQR